MGTTQTRNPGGISRTGFNSGSLATAINYPTLSREQQTELVMLNGSAVIDYTYFSLSLSSTRKLAYGVG